MLRLICKRRPATHDDPTSLVGRHLQELIGYPSIGFYQFSTDSSSVSGNDSNTTESMVRVENSLFSNENSQLDDRWFDNLHDTSLNETTSRAFLSNFDDWWKVLSVRLISTGSPATYGLIRNLGRINFHSGGDLRKVMSRSQIRALETQYLLSDSSSSSPRTYSMLTRGLCLLQDTSDFYAAGGLPCPQMVSHIMTFFKTSTPPPDAFRSAEYHRQLASTLWNLSLCAARPSRDDLRWAASRWTAYLSGGGATAAAADGPNAAAVQLIDRLVTHNKIAGAFLNWRIDPDRLTDARSPPPPPTSGESSFWRSWYAASKTLLQARISTLTDPTTSESTEGIRKKNTKQTSDFLLLQVDLNSLAYIVCTNCIAAADRFDRTDDFLDARTSIRDFVRSTDLSRHAEPPNRRSKMIGYVAMENAMCSYSAKCNANIAVAQSYPEAAPDRASIDSLNFLQSLSPGLTPAVQRIMTLLLNSKSNVNKSASFLSAIQSRRFEQRFSAFYTYCQKWKLSTDDLSRSASNNYDEKFICDDIDDNID